MAAARAPARKRSAGTAAGIRGGLQQGDLVVVDSAPLIYLLGGHPAFAPLFEGLFEAYEHGVVRIALSTIAVAEVLAGPFKHGQEAGQTLREGAG